MQGLAVKYYFNFIKSFEMLVSPGRRSLAKNKLWKENFVRFLT